MASPETLHFPNREYGKLQNGPTVHSLGGPLGGLPVHLGLRASRRRGCHGLAPLSRDALGLEQQVLRPHHSAHLPRVGRDHSQCDEPHILPKVFSYGRQRTGAKKKKMPEGNKSRHSRLIKKSYSNVPLPPFSSLVLPRPKDQ